MDTIQDWEIFLLFLIVDGWTTGKDRRKLVWFIQEAKHYKQTVVDEFCLVAPESDARTEGMRLA